MDFSGWFPSGELTSLYALIILVGTIPVMRWGNRDVANVAGLLFLSWVLARTSTWLEVSVLQILGSAAIMVALAFINTRIASFVLGLHCLKLLSYGLHSINVLNEDQMWSASEVFGYMQMIVLIGGSINGNGLGNHIVSLLRRCGDIFLVPVRATARRVTHFTNRTLDDGETHRR